eukprot:8742001-Prorocentrum_lima.AAC.1
MGNSSHLIAGCQTRGVCMTQIPRYQPRPNRLIERAVGIVKEHMRKVLHAANWGPSNWPCAA